jgi:hypothetical protein
MRQLQLENGNLTKNVLSKIKSLCHDDSKQVFRLNIVQVLSEKNKFKVFAAFMMCMGWERGGGYWWIFLSPFSHKEGIFLLHSRDVC